MNLEIDDKSLVKTNHNPSNKKTNTKKKRVRRKKEKSLWDVLFG
jgi:hypothetical protein